MTSAALPEGPLLGVSRATIYKYVPELRTGQRPQLDAGAPAPAELAAS